MGQLVDALKLIAGIGPAAVLVVVLLLIVQEPSRAEKLKALLLQPGYRFFRWSSKQYLAARVGSAVSAFFKLYIGKALTAPDPSGIQIRWVSSASDPILSEDGTLILCLEDSNDQTRNILSATRLALPKVVCPTLRAHVKKYLQSSIDLAVLQKMAEALGRHAPPVFQRHFLAPELETDGRIGKLFSELVEIDSKGIFVFIFLEELNGLGERAFRSGSTSDKTDEAERFLQFLLTLARRELGEEVQLDYLSNDFRVGVTLVAKSAKAAVHGVVPYLKSVESHIRRGCESIYLVGFAPSAKVYARTLDALGGDRRVSIEKQSKVRIQPDMKSNFSNTIDIALVRTIPLFAGETFGERVQAAGLQQGMIVDGVVIDVTKDVCVLEVGGVTALLRRGEADWKTVVDCSERYSIGERLRVQVKTLDEGRGQMEVTRKLPTEDPWRVLPVPEAGDIVNVEVMHRLGNDFVALYRGEVEVLIGVEDISWLGPDAVDEREVLGSTQTLQITERDDAQHRLRGSIRLLEQDPWPNIHQRFPRGTELRGTVLSVTPNYVIVSLPGGFLGHIPKDAMLRAGHEFADFQSTVVAGQGLDVVVTKVFLAKRRIRLDLKRNVRVVNS